MTEQQAPIDEVDVWCHLCRAFHPARVAERDIDGFPSRVDWLADHTAPGAALLAQLEDATWPEGDAAY